MEKPWIIYGICRPNRGVIYVGATNNLQRRLKEHRQRFRGNISVVILEDGIGEGRDEAEHQWISLFRDLNVKIANKTDGGNGFECLTDEAKAKISAALKGRPKPDGHGAKVSAYQKGRPKNFSAEGISALREKGRDAAVAFWAGMTDDDRIAWGAKVKSLQTAETIQKLSAATTLANYRTWSSYSEQERAARGKAIAEGQAAKISTEQRRAITQAGGSAASKQFWARLTPEERSAEARRRALVRYAKPREASS